MDLLSAAESARRVRAAEGYAGFQHADLARHSGITLSTIRRLAAHTHPRSADRGELLAIAEACGVPERFMLEGFAPMEEAGLDQRLAALEDAVAALTKGEEPEAEESPSTSDRRPKRLRPSSTPQAPAEPQTPPAASEPARSQRAKR